MDLRYEGGLAGEPNLRLVEWGVTSGCNCMGRLSKLRRWHEQDPVDERELRRNEAIFGMQENRNPFVDHPEWVDVIYDAPELILGPGLSIFDPLQAQPWINELHYENIGPDQGEGIEIAGSAGTRLTGWTIMLYNGRDGRAYAEVALDGQIDDEGLGYGAVWFPVSSLQNGGADGLALVDPLGQVVEFLSYEGRVEAFDGPAVKQTSTDIGVMEDAQAPVGLSLQRVGTGFEATDFQWTPAQASPGALNPNQVIFRSIRLPALIQFSHNFDFRF
jgi:hypothetical protein